MTGKKVIFDAQDNVSQKANQMYTGMLANAQKQTNVQKEQVSLLEKEIKLLEKKVALETSGGRKILQEQEALLRHAKTPQESTRYAQNVESVKRGLGESTAVIELLKGLLAEEKRVSSATEKAEKASQRKNISSEQQWQAMRSLATQEVRENREGVKSKIRAAEKNNYEDLDPRTAEKLMYQKQLVGSDKQGGGGIFGQVFAGVLAAGIVQQIAQSLGKIVGTTSGEQAVNSLLGGIPVVGGLLSAGGERHRQEQFEVQKKELELGARTGSKITGATNLSSLGYSAKEALGLTEGLIGAAGNASGANQTGGAATLQRGFGLSNDSVLQIAKDIRTTHSHADIMEIAGAVVAANPELKKDQTKFAEILAQTSQLTNTLSTQTEHVDMKFNAGLVGALRSIGGSFSNPSTAGSQMQTINQSLANPQNDYAKARSFGVLSANNPGADYVQLMEDMERGAGKQGYLSGVLKQIMRQTGGGRQSIIGIQQAFKGLSMSASEAMYTKFKKDPQLFDNLTAKGGTADLEKMFGTTSRAKEATQKLDVQKAEVDNAYLMSASAGDMKIGSLTIKAGAGVFKEAVDVFSGAVEKLTGAQKGFFNIFDMGVPQTNKVATH